MRVVSRQSDGTIAVWNTVPTSRVYTLGKRGQYFGPDESGKGIIFAEVAANRVDLVDVTEGRVLSTVMIPSEIAPQQIRWERGGDIVVILDTVARVVTAVAADGHRQWFRALPYEEPIGYTLSTSGRLVGVATDTTVQVQVAESGEILWHTDRHANLGSPVAFSADTQFVAFSDVSTETDEPWYCIRVFDIESGRESRCLVGHAFDAVSLSFSRNGRTLLAEGPGTAAAWDVESGVLVRWLDRQYATYGLWFSQDGRQLASGGEDGIRFWDVSSGAELEHLPGRWGIGFLPGSSSFMVLTPTFRCEIVQRAGNARIEYDGFQGLMTGALSDNDHQEWERNWAHHRLIEYVPPITQISSDGSYVLGSLQGQLAHNVVGALDLAKGDLIEVQYRALDTHVGPAGEMKVACVSEDAAAMLVVASDEAGKVISGAVINVVNGVVTYEFTEPAHHFLGGCFVGGHSGIVVLLEEMRLDKCACVKLVHIHCGVPSLRRTRRFFFDLASVDNGATCITARAPYGNVLAFAYGGFVSLVNVGDLNKAITFRAHRHDIGALALSGTAGALVSSAAGEIVVWRPARGWPNWARFDAAALMATGAANCPR
jgi:WD40 repeat protein